MSIPLFLPSEFATDSPNTADDAYVLAAPKGAPDSYFSPLRFYFSQALAASLDEAGNAIFDLLTNQDGVRELIDELKLSGFLSRNQCTYYDAKQGQPACLHVEFGLPPLKSPTGVSIVIPSFNNSAEELQRSIRSAANSLRQAKASKDSEILVIDDGSKFDPDMIIRDLSSTTAPYDLRLIRRKRNRGVARARNLGAHVAHNSIIMFLDADDEVHPQFVHAYLAQIEAGAEVVGCDMVVPDSGEVFVGRPLTCPEIYNRNSFGSGIAVNLAGETLQRLRRRQPLYNPLFTFCYEDWELNCLLRKLGANIAIVPIPLYRYHRKAKGRDISARRYHRYFKRLLPLSTEIRAWIAGRPWSLPSKLSNA